jgi:hypothetical protein
LKRYVIVLILLMGAVVYAQRGAGRGGPAERKARDNRPGEAGAGADRARNSKRRQPLRPSWSSRCRRFLSTLSHSR